jgi:putative peptidoglycan lipid II flippase
VGLNTVLNVLFILTWPREFKHAGLACATVIASVVNGWVLARVLTRRVGPPGWPRVALATLRIVAASVVMAAGAAVSHRYLSGLVQGLPVSGKLRELLAVCGAIAAGLCVYAVMAALLCRRELASVLAALRRRDLTPAQASRRPPRAGS